MKKTFKDSVPTGKKPTHLIINISWLVLLKELTAVYSNHTKPPKYNKLAKCRIINCGYIQIPE